MSFQLPYISDPQKFSDISKSIAEIHKASAASSLFSGSALGKALDQGVAVGWNQETSGDAVFLGKKFMEAFYKKKMSMMFISWQASHFLISSSTLVSIESQFM